MWWVDSRAHCDSWWNCWADIHDIPIPSLMFLVLLESDYSKFKPILNLWNKLTRHSLSLSLFFFQYFIIECMLLNTSLVCQMLDAWRTMNYPVLKRTNNRERPVHMANPFFNQSQSFVETFEQQKKDALLSLLYTNNNLIIS